MFHRRVTLACLQRTTASPLAEQRCRFSTTTMVLCATAGAPVPPQAPPKPTSTIVSSVPKTSEEIAMEESQNQQRQVDPFRIGYNMGMQNVQLETLRTKLDDNLELLKSHFNSLREALRTNHDTVRSLQLEYNKQNQDQLDAGMVAIKEKMDQVSARVHTTEEAVREMTKQHFESLQKHVDDRLENIKDTVKISIALMIAINLWILFLVNQIAHSGPHSNNNNQGRGQSPQQGSSQSAASSQQQPQPPLDSRGQQKKSGLGLGGLF